MTTKNTFNSPSANHRQSATIIPLYPFLQPQQQRVSMLIDGVWSVACVTLWQHKTFTQKEVKRYKALIAEHFYNGKKSEKNFITLIERICIGNLHAIVTNTPAVKPADYLNVHYALGLAQPAVWLEQSKQIRAHIPQYKIGVSNLAKALLTFIDRPSLKEFEKTQKLIATEDEINLLHVYNTSILHLQLSKL